MSRAPTLGWIASAIIVVACGDPYVRTNPYDPDVPVEMVISGPDTLFSLSEFAQYTVQTAPAFPDSAIVWAADTVTIFQGDTSYVIDGSVYLTAGQNGQFESILPPLEPGTIPISVEALIGHIDTTVGRCTPQAGCGPVKTVQYRHSGFKRVILMQRLTRIQLRCPDTHTCAPFTVGTTSTVWLDGFDALGHQIVALTSATLNPDTGFVVASYVSRDSTIASVASKGIRAANVTPLKSGTTWIVAMRKALRDSLQIVVQ
jgi:hypothetical protein